VTREERFRGLHAGGRASPGIVAWKGEWESESDLQKAYLSLMSSFVGTGPHNFPLPFVMKAEKNDHAIHRYLSVFPIRSMQMPAVSLPILAGGCCDGAERRRSIFSLKA
jgi:hypothetical protein